MTFTDQQLDLARRIMAEGGRRTRIAKGLGVSDRQAMRVIALLEKGTPATRVANKARVEELLELDASPYQIALETELTMQGARSQLSKAIGSYHPAEDELRRLACTGATYKALRDAFGFRTIQEALDAMESAFQGCYVSLYEEYGETVLTPVKEMVSRITPTAERWFRMAVSPDHTTCHIQLDDGLPGDEIRLVNFSDIHIGSRYHRGDIFQRCLDLVKADPMGFLWDGGDTVEFNHRESAGDPMEQYLTNTEQILSARDSFEPLVHKYLYKVHGNHCGGRAERGVQLDTARLIAELLGVPYFRRRVLVDIEWRGNLWRMYSTHNWGKAIGQEAVVKECRKIQGEHAFPIHFYTSGHTHQAWIQRTNTYGWGGPGKDITTLDSYVVNAGSFTKQTGSYSHEFTPAPQDLTFLRLRGDGNYKADSLPLNRI